MRWKLHPFVWVLVGFVLMLCISFPFAAPSKLVIRSVAKDEVSAMMGHNRSFFLQVSKKGCVYCEALRELEERSDRLDGAVVYEVELPETPSERDRQWLDETLPHFDYFPALFIVGGDEIACVDVNDLSEFDEKVVPEIIGVNGGNHEG